MLNSNREGVPRVLIESLYFNTKVIISNQLELGLKKFLNNINSFIYDEKKGTEKIIDDVHKKLTEPIDYSKTFIEKKINLNLRFSLTQLKSWLMVCTL